MATPQDLDVPPAILSSDDPAPGEAAWETDGGATRRAADARARTYAETLAAYEAERRAAGLQVLRGMAVQSGAAPSAARG